MVFSNVTSTAVVDPVTISVGAGRILTPIPPLAFIAGEGDLIIGPGEDDLIIGAGEDDLIGPGEDDLIGAGEDDLIGLIGVGLVVVVVDAITSGEADLIGVVPLPFGGRGG